MNPLCSTNFEPTPASPLVICDRLISLAQDADRAGCLATAGHLVQLALMMFGDDDRFATRHAQPSRRSRPAVRRHGAAARGRVVLNA